jgi:hypothetical protein
MLRCKASEVEGQRLQHNQSRRAASKTRSAAAAVEPHGQTCRLLQEVVAKLDLECARLVLCGGEGDGAGGEGVEGDGGVVGGEDHLSSGSAGHRGTPHGRSNAFHRAAPSFWGLHRAAPSFWRAPQSCSFVLTVWF